MLLGDKQLNSLLSNYNITFLGSLTSQASKSLRLSHYGHGTTIFLNLKEHNMQINIYIYIYPYIKNVVP